MCTYFQTQITLLTLTYAWCTQILESRRNLKFSGQESRSWCRDWNTFSAFTYAFNCLLSDTLWSVVQ